MDFDSVDAWVFDLDNTLYPATASLFPQIDRRMKLYIAQALGLEPDQAFRLQKQYYREYGTTLRGLMLRHGLEPEPFLEFVHAVDHSVLSPNPALDAALARLPGRKLVFTNGSERHAIEVLAHLGIAAHFEAIFDIRAGGYIPKPDPKSYAQMVRHHAIDPRTAAMFEDSAENLIPAAALGMTTVWVRHPSVAQSDWCAPEPADISHCHHITGDLVAWLGQAIPD
ncbi:MAG: pyrimidine 5'-nucleotidase [Alphaproteobacteria bacterium]|nr:pyrimidine 5'-nucleotidase [Alphaproteobacteria bacterium]